MKLISLTCDHPSFRPLYFKPEGISLIVGDSSEHGTSSNGVGKTLALKVVHLCLGAKKDELLSENIPDWTFHLNFEINGRLHTISRRGDGQEILLDKKKVKYKELLCWLDRWGPFDIPTEKDGITFRSLYSRFGRLLISDRTEPTKTTKETDYDALLRSLYLLGVDISLVRTKKFLRTSLSQNDDLQNILKSQDKRLQKLLLGDSRPDISLEKLQTQIKDTKAYIKTMNISKNYEEIRKKADKITRSLRDKEKEIAIVKYQLRGINDSLKQYPDISRTTLLSFYDGLTDIFKPEVMRSFEDVANFHHSLAENRQQRLTCDQKELSQKLKDLEKQRSSLAHNRDSKLRALSGKTALDDYQVVIRDLALKEQEEKILTKFINGRNDLQDEAVNIKKEMADQNIETENYLKTKPIKNSDEIFSTLVAELYPKETAGINLDNNTGNNMLRYKLSVYVQGHASDGINAARIICFDWLIFTHGAHHSIGHLWHDNGLFDHIDPTQRAKWLSFVNSALKGSGKQYILSLNTENYNSLQPLLNEHEKNSIAASVILKLLSDDPKNKLLGKEINQT